MNTLIDPDRLEDRPRRPLTSGRQSVLAARISQRYGLDLLDAVSVVDLVLVEVELERTGR